MGNGNPYFAEWRQGVNDELTESARLHKEASVNFEHLNTLYAEHDKRLNKLEDSPQRQQSAVGTYGGCVGQIVGAVFTLIGLVISITALILTLTH